MKFRLVEEFNQEEDKLREYVQDCIFDILSLSPEEIALDAPFLKEATSPSSVDSMFILPTGKIVIPTDSKLSHPVMAYALLLWYDKIYGEGILPTTKNKTMSRAAEVLAEQLTNELGMVRLNPGKADTNEKPYVVCPADFQPTRQQYNVIEEYIQMLIDNKKNNLLVFTKDLYHPLELSLSEYDDPYEVVRKIRRSYSSNLSMFEKYYKHYREKHNLDEYAEKNTYTFTVIHPDDHASYESIEAYSKAQAKLLAHKKWPRCYIRELKEQPVEKAQTEIDLAQFAGGTK